LLDAPSFILFPVPKEYPDPFLASGSIVLNYPGPGQSIVPLPPPSSGYLWDLPILVPTESGLAALISGLYCPGPGSSLLPLTREDPCLYLIVQPWEDETIVELYYPGPGTVSLVRLPTPDLWEVPKPNPDILISLASIEYYPGPGTSKTDLNLVLDEPKVPLLVLADLYLY
jgi:hypothetical protein